MYGSESSDSFSEKKDKETFAVIWLFVLVWIKYLYVIHFNSSSYPTAYKICVDIVGHLLKAILKIYSFTSFSLPKERLCTTFLSSTN